MTAVRMFVCRQCDKPRHPSWRRTVRFVSKPPTFWHVHVPVRSVMKSGEVWIACRTCGQMLEVRK